MGTFTQTMEVSDLLHLRARRVQVLVDTGATFSVLPSSVLGELGVNRDGKVSFILADERKIVRDIGKAVIRVGDRETATAVVFGDEGTDILGAHALEGLLVAVDP